MGTSVRRRDRPAENRGRMSKGGMVPSSSQKNTARLGSLPPCSFATENNSRARFWIIRLATKFLVASSSGRIRKMAHFSLTNSSASMLPSKQITCSSSVSRNAFSLESTVDMMEFIPWSDAVNADPASHFALWSAGSRLISSWNWLPPRREELCIKSSCTSLNTEAICRISYPPVSSGGRNSASSRTTDASSPSAES